MKDNEIIKDLSNEKYMTFGGHGCVRCKYRYHTGDERCGIKGCKIARNALNLINRQKEEIERYKGVIKRLEDDVRLAKIETVKDFGKLLIDKIDNGVITHSFDIVDLVADEVERIEKGKEDV